MSHLTSRSEVHPSWCFRWWICMWLWLVAQISPQVWVYMPVLKALTWNTGFLSDRNDCEAQAIIWKKICLLMWLLIRLRNVVSESQGQGAESRKSKGQCKPKSPWSLGAFLWNCPDSVETRYMGWCETQSWGQCQRVTSETTRWGNQDHSSTSMYW